MSKPKREYKQRAATFEDIAREFVKGESLEVQLAASQLVAKAKAEALAQAKQRADATVVDFKRGWTLTEG